MSLNGRQHFSLSVLRFHPTPAPAQFSTKQIQPNSPSSFSSTSYPHTPSAATRPPRASAPQPYIASPTNTALSPSQSRLPYAAYDDIPPITSPLAHTQPLPPKTILVAQPNGPSILVNLPPQPVQRPPSQLSYFRSQQLTQAVAPVSPASMSMLRAAAPSPDMMSSSGQSHYEATEASRFKSSHVSTAQSEYCEPSVVSIRSRGSLSRRVSVNAPLQPFDSHSAPSPTPPLVASTTTAPGEPQPAAISYPTDFSSLSWSMFFLSLPASPVFLHYLSVSLVSLHAALLLVSLLLFLLTLLPALSPMSQPLCFYLLFYAVKSTASLAMCAYRLSHPDCWQVDDLSSSPRSARYHVLRHTLRCVNVAATGVVSWWLFAADGSLGEGAAVSRYVLALLCLEYLSILLPLLSNLALSFFVPCIHLSFYLPYLPFPALQSAAPEEEADKGGMSEEDLTHLPSTRWHPSAIARDTTCAVCLAEIEEDEEIRQLTCRHMYHRPCIDMWLRKRGVCPLCVRKVSVKPGRKTEAGVAMAVAGRGGDEAGRGVVEMGALASVDEVTLNVSGVAVVPAVHFDVDLHPDQLEA